MDASYLDLLMAQQGEISEEAVGGGGVWVVADLLDGAEAAIAPVTLEAVGAARNLADSLGAYVYGVLLGDGVTELAQSLYQVGADGVRVADHPALASFALEPYLEVLAELFAEEQPEIVLLGATEMGQALAPRLAQRMGGGLIEHVTAVGLDESSRAARAAFPIYGGEYFKVVTCRSAEAAGNAPESQPQFLTVEPGAFPMPFIDEYREGEPTILEVEVVEPLVRKLGPAEDFQPLTTPLSEAPVIVAAGRQVGDFGLVEQLAQTLDAQVAGDRGAWDAGLIDVEQLIDVRGTTVAPDVYLALGIRGDTFHDAAIEGAKFIVAVHPDPAAPIFEIADLCLEAEPQEVAPMLLDVLQG